MQIVGNLLRSIRVAVDDSGTRKYLNDVQRKKIPKCTAIALTKTAKALQGMLEKEVERVFDRPVTFTKRAFAIKPATVGNLQAEVFIKTKQAAYLSPQIVGGRRQPKRFEQRFAADASAPGQYWMPGEGVKLNVHGNLSLAQVRKIAAQLQKSRRTVFVGKPNPTLPFGIWERLPRRKGGTIKPLLVLVKQPQYRKRLDIHALADKHAQRIFNAEFSKAWNQYFS